MPKTDHDAIKAALASIATADVASKKTPAQMQSALIPLKALNDDYLVKLKAKSSFAWTDKILDDTHARISERIVKGPQDDKDDILADLNNEIGNAIGWVVPRPVDQAVIDAVIKKDRAAEAAEKALKG